MREQSYATIVDQPDCGITALAVPIRGAEGGTVAAVNSSGYSAMVTAVQLVTERLRGFRTTASHIANHFAPYRML